MIVKLLYITRKIWVVSDEGRKYYITPDYIGDTEVIIDGYYQVKPKFISSDGRLNINGYPTIINKDECIVTFTRKQQISEG